MKAHNAMRKVTIQAIAERAGVSRGTVDRVLHNRPNVKPEIQQRVQRIVSSTGYGAQGADGDNGKKHIGVLLPGNDWFGVDLKKEWMRGFQDARQTVEMFGISVELVECETDLPNEFAERIAALQASGLNGLAISAKNNLVMRRIIDDLAAQGIPVVTYNSDIQDSGRICFVGQDLYRSGRVAADLITKYTGAQDDMLIVAGNLEIDAHRQRVAGFIDKCEAAGKARQRLQVVESFNEYVMTYEKVLEQLERRPALRAVYMANESVAACVEAIERSGRQGPIMVVGNDLTTVTRRLLKEGMVDFIIEQDLYWQGYQPVMLLKDLLQSPGMQPEPLLFTKMKVMNAENIG